MSLGPVFIGGLWFWPTAVAVVAAAAGSALGRRFGLLRPAVPLAGLLALGLFLTWLYARDVAVWRVFPGPAAWDRLAELVRAGATVVNGYATPVPTQTGVVLLTAAGVGLVALAVDTLAVTYRSAALAGLPLFALYAVPVAVVRHGVPWVLFTVAALGWLALMLTEGNDRILGWGRALGRRHTELRAEVEPAGHDTRLPPEPLGMVGRRIGAAALGIALLVPWLVPGLDEGVFGRGGGGGVGAGSGRTVLTVNPFVSLQADLESPTDSEVLTFTTDDPNPDYLRMVTLDTFDGTTWTPAVLRSAGSATDTQPTAPGLSADVARSDVRTDIKITALRQTWLPLPYPTVKISKLRGSWAYDEPTRNVFALRGDSLGASYQVTSLRLQPTAAQLRAAGPAPPTLVARYTQLPDQPLPDLVTQTAREVTANATTDYDKALALQQYFLSKQFTYSTRIPSYTGSPLAAFLTDKVGFCQQFSSTFAVMARLLGLPTRVNVGFTHGTKTSDGTWTVSRTNAHAWPEVYFQGVGWVRFEPTPGPAGVGTPSYAPATGSATTNPDAGASGGPSANPSSSTDPRLSRLNEADRGAAAAAAPRSVPWHLVVLGLLVVIALTSPALVRWRRRARRLGRAGGVDPVRGVQAAWRELADSAGDLGRPWSHAETPRQTAQRLATELPGAAEAAGRLALSVERSRYARTPGPIDHVVADTRTVLAELERSAGRASRWRARLLPSTVLSAGAARVADMLDWLDSGWAAVRRALPGS
jgi:transglutaminase-like putative cysteine protease